MQVGQGASPAVAGDDGDSPGYRNGGIAEAWTSGMPVESAVAGGGASSAAGVGQGEGGEDGDGDGEEEEESSSEDSSSDDEDEDEEDEHGLNEGDWMQVESGATYERSIAGWDVYKYAIDGV